MAKKITLYTCLLLLLTWSVQAQVSDGFDYGPSGSIAGNGTATNGWDGPWQAVSAADTSAIVVGGVYNNNLLVRTATNRAVIYSTSAENRYQRYFDTPYTSSDGEFWFSAHMAIDGDPAGNVGSMVLIDTTQGTAERIVVGKRFGNRNVFATGPGSGATNTGQFFEGIAARWVVGHLTYDSGADNWQLDLWVDPDPASTPMEMDAQIINKTYPSASFHAIRIKSEGAPGITFSVDDIFLGASFADVVPDDLIDIDPVPPGAIEKMDYTALDSLVPQSGGSGFDGDWTLLTGTNPLITEGGIESTTLSRRTSGNKVDLSSNARVVRSLAGSYGDVGRTFWVGYWFQTTNAGPNVSHLVLADENTFGATGPDGRLAQIGSGFNNVNIALVGGGGTGISSAEGHFVVLEIVTNGAPENDQIYIYIDPDLGVQPAREDANAQGARDLTNWNAIGLIVEGSPGVTAVWDDIYVGNSYQDIVPDDLIDTSIPTTAIAFDQFDYTAGDDLFGLGGMQDGWAGDWDTILTETPVGTIVAGGVANDQLLVKTSSNSFEGQSTGDNNRFIRYLETPINPTDNSEFWFSTHMALSGNVGNNVGTMVLSDTTQGNYERIIIGKRFGNRNLFVTGPGTGAQNTGQFFESTSARWVVGQLVASDTSENWILNLWVDPDPGMEPMQADADIADKLFPTANFNAVSLKTEGEAGLNYQVDDIFLGSTFLDVVPAILDSIPPAPPGAAEPMDYAAGEGLDAQNGGTGWDDTWMLVENDDPTITEGGIENFVLLKQTSNNKATFDSNSRIIRKLDGDYGDNGRSFWVGFWFDSENGGPNVTNLVLADSENFAAGAAGELLQIGRSFNGSVLRIIGQGQTTAAADEGHFVVLELVTNGTADNDEVYMWVDPPLDRTPLRDTADVMGNANLTNWDAIALKVAGDPGVTAEWDDIYVGREYSDIVPNDLLDVQAPGVPVVATEPFDYTVGEDLAMQNGGEGWSGPWVMEAGTATIASGSIASDRVDGTGNKVGITQSGTMVSYTRPFFARFAADSPDASEVWMTFLLDVTQNSIGNSGGLTLLDGSDAILSIGATTGLGNIAVTYNGNDPVVSSDQTVNGVSWVVVQLKLYGDGITDTARIWVNPLADVLPDENNTTFTITDLEVANGFDQVRIEAQGAQNLNMCVDEIYTGFSFRDVSPNFGSSDPDLFAYEPFNYDAGETLFGQGGINAFWDGVWMDAGMLGAVNELEITPGSTAFPGFQTIGNTATYRYLEEGTQIRADRKLAFPLASDGRTYWVTFFMNTTEGAALNNVGNVTLRNTNVGAANGQRLAMGRLYGTGKLGFVTPATGNARATEVDDLGLHWLVTRITTNADPAIPDTVWMWIDPTPQVEPDTATALVMGVSDFLKAGPIDIIRIRTEGAAGGEAPYITNFDELRIATAWESAAVLVNAIEPEQYDVFQLSAFPNPFQSNLQIEFTAVEAGPYSLELYDVQGKKVNTLLNSQLPAGEHRIQWEANGLANGFYFLRIVHGQQSTVRKLILYR